MRKATRLVVLLLAVIMTVGILPLTVLADDVSVNVPTSGSVSREELINAVGQENVILDMNLDSVSSVAKGVSYPSLGTDISGSGFTGNGSQLAVVNGNGCITPVDDGNGGKAFQYGLPVATDQVYIDFINKKNATNGTSICGQMYDYRNTGFVISVDVKGGEKYFAKDLFAPLSRVNGGPDSIFLVSVDENGMVYAKANMNVPVAVLSRDEFTTISAYVDIPNLKYYVYINGVNMTPEGYKFMDAGRYAGKTFTYDDETKTTQSGEYYLNAVRFCQVTAAECNNLLTAPSYIFDNYRVYYTTPELGYVGEYTEKVVGLSAGILFGEDGKVVTTPGVVTVAGTSYYVVNNYGLIRTDDVETVTEVPLGVLPAPVYTDLEDTTYIKKDGSIQNWEVRLDTMDISGYDYIAIDVYRPAEYVDTNFQFNCGQRERFYYVDFDGTNYTLRSPVEWTYSNPGGLSTIGNQTLKTADGSVSISGSLRSNSNGYYLRTWDYYYKRIALDTDLAVGWNTVTIPISSLSNSQRTSFEIISLACTGWSMNDTRSWNPEKNSNKLYPDAAKCDIRFKNLRLVKNDGTKTPEIDGWSFDNTYYVSPNTHKRVTGIQVIDGKWYDFGTDGTLVGKLDGLCTVKLADGSDVTRLYVDGVIAFGLTESNGKTYYGDKATGAIVTGKIADVDGVYYSFDAEGDATICSGIIEVDSKKMNFVNGVPTAGNVVENGIVYVFGDDGVLTKEFPAGDSTITIKVVKDGVTTTEEKVVANGSRFEYVVEEHQKCIGVYANGVEISDTYVIDLVVENVTVVVEYRPDPSPDAHRLDGGKQTQEVSCGVNGIYVYTCQDCGGKFTEIIPMLNDHEYDEGVVTLEPGCATEGVKTYTCSRCHGTKEEAIPATEDHTFSTVLEYDTSEIFYNNHHYYVCTVCGIKKDPTEHKFDTIVYVDENTHVKKCVCGYSVTVAHNITKEYDAVNHWDACLECGYELEKVAHTLVMKNNAEGHFMACSDCAYAQIIEAHDPVNIQDYVAPTCTSEGSTTGSKCSVCEYVITPVETIGKLPHTEAENYTIDGVYHWKVCTVCGTVLEDTKSAHVSDMQGLTNIDKEEGTATDICTICNNEFTVDIPTWFEELGLTKTADGKYVSDQYFDKLVKYEDGWRYFDATGALVYDAANVDYLSGAKGVIYNGKIATADGTFAIVELEMVKNTWVVDSTNNKEYFYGEDGKLVKPADGTATIVANDILCNVEPDGAHLVGVVDNGDGTHSYYCDGIAGKRKNAFITSEANKVYYADATGILLKGAQRISDVYYLFGDGVEGELYVMIKQYRNEFVPVVFGENIFVNAEGKAVTGWIMSNGKEYYINEDKTLAKGNLVQIGTSVYDFDGEGALIGKHTGWVVVENGVARLPEEGDVCNRYIYYGSYVVRDFAKPEGEGNIYYFNADGDKVVSTTVIARGVNYAYALYTFDENGVMVSTSDGPGFGLINGTPGTYGYFQNAEDGLIKAELREIDGKLYYFDEFGVRVENAAVTVDGVKYWFNEDGEGAIVKD